MPDSLITLTLTHPTATITLNRPDKLNALNADMLTQLEAIAAQLEQDKAVRVVFLTGAGERAFCVGADIKAWAALEPLDMWRHWIRDGHRVFNRLAHLPQPVIAVLNGYTFGGGLELALAADLRLAADHIALAFPEVKIGVIPGWTGSQRLSALIGLGRAKQMILTGGRVDAATAEQWGLVNEVVPATELRPRAEALAAEIAQNGPLAVQISKQLLNGAMSQGLEVTLEALAGGLAAYTDDLGEGVAAFNQRRPANFTGN